MIARCFASLDASEGTPALPCLRPRLVFFGALRERRRLSNCQALRTRRVVSRASACQIVTQTPATPEAGRQVHVGKAKSMIFGPISSRLSLDPGLSM